MATVERFVNTASSGGDGQTNNTSGATAAYASLTSWEANAGGSATDDYIVHCCGTAADTAGAVAVNFPTDITTGSVLIQGNRTESSGHSEDANTISTSAYRLSIGNSGFSALSLEETNTTVDGIQVEYAQAGNFGVAVAVITKQNLTIRKCRIRNTGACWNGIGADNSIGQNGLVTIDNNVVVGFTQAQIKYTINTHFSPTINVRHNTCWGNNAGSGVGILLDRGGGSSNPTIVVSGNACANNAGSDISVSGSLGSLSKADNACEDATGEISITNTANTWTSPSTAQNSKFTVKDTSSVLYNAVNPTLLATDVVDFTRDGTNHDVGAFEFQVPDEDVLLGQGASFAMGTEVPGISVSL